MDDNEDGAIIIIKKALIDAGVPNETAYFDNGTTAFNYLKNESNQKPVLIVLDLKMTGNEFLGERIRHPSSMIIPVIILTAIESVSTKRECFKLHISGYMQKPSGYKDMVHPVEAIYQYWSFSEMALNEVRFNTCKFS